MYWQKRFDRENPDIELEEKIHEIHKCNKDYGYRRMCGELRNQGHIVNKKKRSPMSLFSIVDFSKTPVIGFAMWLFQHVFKL